MNLLNYIYKSPHRNQLEKYLKLFLPQLEGPILEVGSKNRRYDNLFKVKPVAIDIVENKEREVQAGNVTGLEFNSGSFKSVVSLEVLEYVMETEKAIKEVSRILSSGGVFVFSIPFMYRIHGDVIRLTQKGLTDILNKYFTQVKFYPLGNSYSIILDIIRGRITMVRFFLFRYIFYILYSILVLFVPISEIFKGNNYVSGYFVVAKK